MRMTIGKLEDRSRRLYYIEVSKLFWKLISNSRFLSSFRFANSFTLVNKNYKF